MACTLSASSSGCSRICTERNDTYRMAEHLRKLIDHLKWADTAVLDALRAAPGSDTRALTLYAHVLGAEAVWLARLAGTQPDVAVWPTLSLDDAARLAARNVSAFDEILETLGSDDVHRVVDYRNSAGRAFRDTVEDILMHVALHGSYHRGQISMVIRGGGGEPAPTDYIAFVRGVPAARTVPPTPVV
jgi:uncharacterized damage-inducible protein DinB